MELFGAWECGPVPWDFAAFVRFWFPSTRGYLVVVSSLSLDWKDWGEKTPRPLASSTGHAVNAVHPAFGRLGLQVCDRNTHCMGMIGVIAPLLPIEIYRSRSHSIPWQALKHWIITSRIATIATTELHWMACITIDSMPGVSENPRSGRLRTAYALASLLSSRSKDACGRAEHWKWASSSWEGDISRIPDNSWSDKSQEEPNKSDIYIYIYII